MTCPVPMPGVFGDQRHLVAADAPAHHSAHLGRRYRALCGEMCLPQPVGPYTWCGWPVCDACRTVAATARPAVVAPVDVPRGRIDRPRTHAA